MALAKTYQFKSPSRGLIHSKIIKGYVALYITSDYWILAKGYKLYKYYPIKDKIESWTQLKDPKCLLASKFKLVRRALRAEITHLYNFSGDWYCIARKAIFKYNTNSGLFEICHKIARGSRPMNLCQDVDGSIYYGEYFFNPSQSHVSIFRTRDRGANWECAYTFKNGRINHIHGLFIDKYTHRLWVFTGDDDNACIAGYTTDGFKTFHVEFEGEQKYRVCVPIFMKESIIYPTDSQYTQNTIRLINRNTKEIIDLQPIQGSGIYALDAQNIFAVSTTVEPSKVNQDQYSHLWYSFDGTQWTELISFKKDKWKATLFQFGSIRFPHYESSSDYLIFNGRAINTLDQNTLIIPISELKK